MLIASKTIRISALLPSSLVMEVKKESEKNSITQSSIIKSALEFWLRNKLENDAKSLAKMNFDDLPSEDDWALIQSPV
ncbi:hypothetical protein KAI65_03370 [Candidatus Parcubacteria bacterium]|nr:hypothetical protein [Candidatus Parcubacteria bacterium]